MSSSFEMSEKRLIINNFEVNFDYNIENVVYWDGVYVVLLHIPNESKEVDNIYGVDCNGDIIWRIENPIQAFNVDENVTWYDHLALSIYVGLNLTPAGDFSATTFFGIKYTFDHKSGKLLEKEFVK